MKEADKNKAADLRAPLVEAGVPENVVEYALSRRPSSALYHLFEWAQIAIMALGFLAGVPIWNYLEGVLERNAFAAARDLDAVLYWHNFGIGMLVALFGWIFAASYISLAVQNWGRRTQASLFVYGILDTGNQSMLGIRSGIEKLRYERNPQRYMEKTISGWLARLLFIVAVFSVPAALIVERELHTYKIFTREKYFAYPLFPWEDVKSGRWASAELVELGCNHITGRNADDDVIYIVNFDSGRSPRLGSAFPLNGSWLDGLEAIDSTLREANVRFERWRWLDRDPLHPECLKAQEHRFSPDEFRRLKRLIRVGEFEGDS